MICGGVDIGHGAVQEQRPAQLAIASDQRLASRTRVLLRWLLLLELMGCQIRSGRLAVWLWLRDLHLIHK